MQWQKSPQYADMPHEQYMQTAEGKKSQQAFQQWDQWQQNMMPTPPKPGTGSPGGMTNRYDGAGFAADGTPVAGNPRMRGQQPASSGGNFSAHSPGQAQPVQPTSQGTPYSAWPSSQYSQAPQFFNVYAAGTSDEYVRNNPDTTDASGNWPSHWQRPGLPQPILPAQQGTPWPPSQQPQGGPNPLQGLMSGRLAAGTDPATIPFTPFGPMY